MFWGFGMGSPNPYRTLMASVGVEEPTWTSIATLLPMMLQSLKNEPEAHRLQVVNMTA